MAAGRQASHADVIECYGQASLRGARVELECALYLPDVARPPLVVWFHGGGFVTGHFQQYGSQTLGRRLRDAGVAMASVAYRLKAEASDLSEAVQAREAEIAAHRGKWLKPRLSGPRALAAMEDGMAFLDWAETHAERFGWSDTRVLAGASAGAITAFNMAFTAERAGFAPPQPAGIMSFSGGYGFPELLAPDRVGAVLALHNSLDDRVSVRSVRAMKRAFGAKMELIESTEMVHGKLAAFAGEKPWQSYDRIVDFVHRVTG